MKEKTRKVVCSILLITILLSNLSIVFATEIGSTEDIISKGECPTNVWYGDIWIQTFFVGFEEDGEFRPAYCINPGIPGVDDDVTYEVEIEDMSKLPNQEALWRVLVNGYPYKSAKEMGLDSDWDAYFATKQAIYRTIDGKSTDPYSAQDESGRKVVNKIKELVNIGKNGTQTYKDPVINISKVNQVGIDNKDSNYISQTFKVDSQVEMKEIKLVLNSNSAPSGTYIGDTNNNKKTSFNQGDTFKILVPRNQVTEDIEVQVSVDGKCKTYPILYGRAPSEDLQNYLVTSDPFVMSTAKFTLKYSPSGEIEIDKITNGDNEITGTQKGEGIEGVTFVVKAKDGSYEKKFTTDQNGKIVLGNMKLGDYVIYEEKVPDYYLQEEIKQYEVTLSHDGESKKLVVENTPVEIEVDVDKTSDKTEAQGNEIVTYTIDSIKNLSNVELNDFTLTDYLPKEVKIQSLKTGTYNQDLNYSITYNTNKRENIEIAQDLSTQIDNEIDFTKEQLEEGEYITSYSLHFGKVEIGFENTSKMFVTTKVNEGLVDESTFINNVKVYGHYLEAKAEDEDDVPVEVYENVLKIRKVSKEYNQYTDLPANTRINAVFELLDENQEYIATLNVSNTEDYIYKYLETGKTYYLKEIAVDSYYVISDELIEFKFEKNGQTIELEVENDNVNLLVDVEKDAVTEAERGEIIDYTFDNIGNYSNTKVSNFIWGDKLPRQVRVQELQTGTWNEDLEYEIQFITNKNTNWKNIGEKYSTTENYKINLTSEALGLQDDEYVTEFRLVFGEVKAGFEADITPIVKAKVNDDVQNNKIFVNDTYVTADYMETKLEAEDDAHTIVYTKTPTPEIEKELPKTGM